MPSAQHGTRRGALTSCHGDCGRAGPPGFRAGDALRGRRMPRWGGAGCIWGRGRRGTSGQRTAKRRVAQLGDHS